MHTCPNCGYCPCCGRPNPYYTQPYSPPYYTQPYTWGGLGGANVQGGLAQESIAEWKNSLSSGLTSSSVSSSIQ